MTHTHHPLPFVTLSTIPSQLATAAVIPPLLSTSRQKLLIGIVVGLLAASIGALYTVVARWGIIQGLHSVDLTALRFGVAGVLMLPVLGLACYRNAAQLSAQWRVWLAVSLLAGTPFGLLMFGALQLSPASHAAVFPFAAMSVMGMLLSSWVFAERLQARKILGIATVLVGLLTLAGLDAASFTTDALLGDFLFITAGTLWAGFGVMLRKHKLNPLLATAVVSFSALVTYIPAYFWFSGAQRLVDASPSVFWIEALVQGVIAGCGTLYTYAKMVTLLGSSRAAIFPALAPGLAALMAWPILNHSPTHTEMTGLLIAMCGLLVAVTSRAGGKK